MSLIFLALCINLKYLLYCDCFERCRVATKKEKTKKEKKKKDSLTTVIN